MVRNVSADAKAGGNRALMARVLLFSLASNLAVLGVFKFGLFMWPDGLPGASHHVFWLASGVNVSGLLLLGARYWPVLVINAIPVWWMIGAPFDLSVIGALSNAIEALAAVWMIRRGGAFTGHFDSVKSVGALVVASVLAPLVNTLLMPAAYCLKGMLPWSEYAVALGNWNLANGAAMLFLTPLLVSLLKDAQLPKERRMEILMAAVFATVLGFIGFGGMLRGESMNLAFLAFLPVIYTSVRFGLAETAIGIGLVFLSIYAALWLFARDIPLERAPSVLWFIQACSWVLTATGLLVAALGEERRRAERRSLEAALAAERARLKTLRYQMNPHFLFNALNSMRASLPLSESVVRDMLTDISGYLRSSLESGEDEHAPLCDEIAHVKEYLRIEQRRFGERLRPQFEIDPESEKKAVPVFLLQPLVENAIRHGLEAMREPCRIVVSARCEQDTIHLGVANTGHWREPRDSKGIGLANVRHRLTLLYGERATLRIDEEDGMVRVNMEVPIV